MSPAAKLAGFGVALAVLFGGGAAAGGAFDAAPPRSGESSKSGSHAEEPKSPTMAMDEPGHAAKPMPVRGLAVADGGVRLVVEDSELARRRAERLRFRIVDARGATVRDFDVEHTKRMHLIVVRRDQTGFQHLHPVQARDGSWSTRLRLRDAGSYRVFADFSRGGKPVTLASDLRVDGPAALEGLPAAGPVATTASGYEVRLAAGRVTAGREAHLRFTVRRNGRPVRVQPYLGANGHLVALRDGDLAFLHVHPAEGVAFEATFPTTGRYGLFLQFKHEGRVHTASFTQEVS